MVEFINKHRDFILLTIGTILVLVSLILLSYDKFTLLKSNVSSEIEMEKTREKERKNSNEESINNEELVIEPLEVDNVTEENVEVPVNQNIIKKEYIGYLEINKINLKSGLVSKNSYYNNVDRNIMMINESDYPDSYNGNIILAAHSGTSSISYFKNLYKLELSDEAIIYYKNSVYTYRLVSIYNVPKNGVVSIKRDNEKACLTLITCTHDSDTLQTVYIFERVKVEEDGA